jgi:hypothetical protein
VEGEKKYNNKKKDRKKEISKKTKPKGKMSIHSPHPISGALPIYRLAKVFWEVSGGCCCCCCCVT